MPTSFYTIHIRKEALKFSAAHMTVFPDGTKERLHGHNFRTEVSISFREFSLKAMIPFSEIKKSIRALCADWDERILMPSLCPFLKREELREGDSQVSFHLCNQFYSLPREEVCWLPVENITTESLAAQFTSRLLSLVGEANLSQKGVFRVTVKIEEITGQGASFTQDLE